jgi:hypothetical protein
MGAIEASVHKTYARPEKGRSGMASQIQAKE